MLLGHLNRKDTALKGCRRTRDSSRTGRARVLLVPSRYWKWTALQCL